MSSLDPILGLLVPVISGVALGTLFRSGGFSPHRAPKGKRAAVCCAAMLRFMILLAAVYLVSGWQPLILAPCVAGFALARLEMHRLSGAPGMSSAVQAVVPVAAD